jgi:hypothetical protein
MMEKVWRLAQGESGGGSQEGSYGAPEVRDTQKGHIETQPLELPNLSPK